MDRISYLPQSILHDILSRLRDRDAARTSVLSKAWHHTWSTFPFLVFVESRYPMIQISNDADVDKYKFSKLVSDTLIRFRCKGLAIRRFKVVFKSETPPAVLSVVNDWMDLACDSGIEVLQLDNGVEELQHEDPRSFACLPLCVLEAKSLIKLELSWDFRVDQAFLNYPIKFSSLRVLSLRHIYLGDGQVIQNLISNCPLFEKLNLFCCFGLKSVSIRGLTKLKVVFIIGMDELDVDAPSLDHLSFLSGFNTFIPCKINMDKCTNIRELCLAYVSSIIITDQWFLELFQKFPLLEQLMLEGFEISNTIKISSMQLKFLDLCDCYSMAIGIDAPNLYEFRYQCDGSIIPFISIMNSSSQLVLNVSFFVDFLLDLESLRTFLEHMSLEHIPVSLLLGFRDDSTVEFVPFELQDYSMVPPSIKHLTLCADLDTKEWSLILVTSLFQSCRPSIVSFDLDINKTLVKIFCEKLISRKEDDCCCSSSQNKCWWHFLKDVKVSSSFRNHNAADDLRTLLEPFPTLSSEEEEEVGRSHFKQGHLKFWLEWQL